MLEHLKFCYRKFTAKQMEAIGVIEVILILVIIIGLVLIFRTQILAIIKAAFALITSSSDGINTEISLE